MLLDFVVNRVIINEHRLFHETKIYFIKVTPLIINLDIVNLDNKYHQRSLVALDLQHLPYRYVVVKEKFWTE